MATSRELIQKFRDMADCADAAYAMLHYVYESIDSANPKKEWEEADKITLGYKLEADIEIKDKNDKIIRKITKDSNTAYARAIEARFCQDLKIYSPNDNKYIEINNDPKNIQSKDDEDNKDDKKYTLSLRTQNFVERYELVHHIPDIASLDTLLAFLTGYSATLFYDTDNKNYILAFRGSEEIFQDMVIADAFLALTGRAITQIEAMNDFATDIFQAIIAHHQKSSNINLNNPNLESKDIA
ncbi:hypothetical protein CQA53_10140 [Helicobacter didelphidarum]|uniref:Uncharacterized protein n=1 Tax=Helicobacter didelphidarum TaxID=2040648 RepID=A0A3D8I8G4_9HELI|nr:hypothetical protein [Helicobacter didelphidarum]RDU61442.1 hypothetical protein CQA53_10140 [Helicobacter didelphidarum]